MSFILTLTLASTLLATQFEAEHAYAGAIQKNGRQQAAHIHGFHGYGTRMSNAIHANIESVDSHAERKVELVFGACQTGEPAVMIGSVFDQGEWVGSFITIWQENSEGWRWYIDDYRSSPRTVAGGRELRAIMPDCDRQPAREQRIAFAEARIQALLKQLEARRSGELVDWLAFDRRNMAEDAIIVGNHGPVKAEALEYVAPYAVKGDWSSGNSHDDTLPGAASSLKGKLSRTYSKWSNGEARIKAGRLFITKLSANLHHRINII